MKIEVIKNEMSNQILQKTLKHCWNVDSSMNMNKLFACNDSILELMEYWIIAEAPRSVCMQMETHKKIRGCYVWLESARPDYVSEKRPAKEYSRSANINMVMKVTARGLKEIAHQRLCNKAELPTREFMKLLVEKIKEVEPCLASELVPLCIFRNGKCTEFNSCKK